MMHITLALILGLSLFSATHGKESALRGNKLDISKNPERNLQDLNIVETALANTDLFSTLVGFVEAADLVTTLSGEGPFTVFAPTNDAFAALPAETVAALTADTSLLAQVLTYHVVPEEILAEDLDPDEEILTVEGSALEVGLDPVTINDANVTTADIEASNGVIHVIDSVLIPPTLVLPTTVSSPATTVASPMSEEPVTGEPPVSEEPVTGEPPVSEEPVTGEPPVSEEPVTEAPPSTDNTIVGLAASTEELSTLAFLLQQGGFLEALSSPGPFTVFAPTNAAFAALPGSGWLAKNPSLLEPTLLYHVIGNATILSTDLQVGTTALTLEKRSVEVTSLDPTVMINDRATVTVADIQASNGVIHIVDTVLIPKTV